MDGRRPSIGCTSPDSVVVGRSDFAKPILTHQIQSDLYPRITKKNSGFRLKQSQLAENSVWNLEVGGFRLRNYTTCINFGPITIYFIPI